MGFIPDKTVAQMFPRFYPDKAPEKREPQEEASHQDVLAQTLAIACCCYYEYILRMYFMNHLWAGSAHGIVLRSQTLTLATWDYTRHALDAVATQLVLPMQQPIILLHALQMAATRKWATGHWKTHCSAFIRFHSVIITFHPPLATALRASATCNNNWVYICMINTL